MLRRPAQRTGLFRNYSRLFARHLARHGPTRSRVAGRVSLPGEIYMFSLVIGFGVATLCATVLLFLLQMLEDFGDA
jgi:hypothetical protein